MDLYKSAANLQERALNVRADEQACNHLGRDTVGVSVRHGSDAADRNAGESLQECDNIPEHAVRCSVDLARLALAALRDYSKESQRFVLKLRAKIATSITL